MESAEIEQAVVSVDWITQCVKQPQQIDIDPYRITLPHVETAYVAEFEVEMQTGPTPTHSIVRPIDPPAPRSRTPFADWKARPTFVRQPSTASQSSNAPAGTSGTRHSTEPREVIKIEVDDDDDCIMLEDPPESTAKSRKSVSRTNYPSPPNTPLENNAILRMSAAPSVPASLSHTDINDGLDGEDDGENE